MTPKEIYITEYDLKRLKSFINEAQVSIGRDRGHLQTLEEELGRARVVPSNEVPADVITMNSRVRLKELKSGSEITLHLCFPNDVEPESGRERVSILAPIGTAIIGCRVGDVVEWEVPAGTRSFEVLQMLYQPESSGDYHL